MMRCLSLFVVLAVCACASPPQDGAGFYAPDDMSLGLGGSDGDGGVFNGGGTAGDDGDPPPNDFGDGVSPPGEDAGIDSPSGDAGQDGLDGSLGNGPGDGEVGGGGGNRGDGCPAELPTALEVGQGFPFLSLLPGDVMLVTLGTDGGATIDFSVRLDGFTDEVTSVVELVDASTDEVIGSMAPIGPVLCVDGEWLISDILLAISPAVDPFSLIGQSAILAVRLMDNMNEPMVLTELELDVILELATD